jgi:hypothetical protein
MSIGWGLEPPPWITADRSWQKGRATLPNDVDDLPILRSRVIKGKLEKRYPHANHKGNMVVTSSSEGIAKCVMPGCMVEVRVQIVRN